MVTDVRTYQHTDHGAFIAALTELADQRTACPICGHALEDIHTADGCTVCDCKEVPSFLTDS